MEYVNNNNLRQSDGAEITPRQAYEICHDIYARSIRGHISQPEVDITILSKFDNAQLRDGIARIDDFFTKNNFLFNNIRGRRGKAEMFRHPVILFVYVMAKHYPEILKSRWKYSDEPLRAAFTDLGRSYEAILELDC